MIQGITEAAAGASPSTRWPSASRRSAEVILEDPDVDSLSSFIGVDGTNTTLNTGRFLINLKPHDERSADVSRRSSAACSARPPQVAGIALYMQPVQDLTIDDRGQPHAVPVRARERRIRRALHAWVAEAARPARQRRRSSPTSPATCRPNGLRGLRRHRPRRPRRASASPRRRSTTRSTTPSASASSRPSSPSRTSTA